MIGLILLLLSKLPEFIRFWSNFISMNFVGKKAIDKISLLEYCPFNDINSEFQYFH